MPCSSKIAGITEASLTNGPPELPGNLSDAPIEASPAWNGEKTIDPEATVGPVAVEGLDTLLVVADVAAVIGLERLPAAAAMPGSGERIDGRPTRDAVC